MGDTGGDERYCSSCGKPLNPTDRFCPQCGTETGAAEGSTASATRDGRTANQPAENGGWEGEKHRTAGIGGDDNRRPGQVRQGGANRGRAPPGLPGLTRGSEPGWRPVATGLGLAVLSIVLLLLFTLLSVPLVGILQLSTGAALIVGAAFGQYFGFFGLALGYLRHTRGFTWTDIREYLGVRFPTLREIGAIIGGYFAILGLVIVVSVIITFLQVESAQNESAQQLTESAGTDPILIVGVFALMFLVIGPCEEILYRGVIQNRLRERLSAVWGIIAASVIFASVHVIALGSTDPVAVLTAISVLAVTSLVLGAVYEYTGNLVVPWLLHSIHNSILVSIAFFGPGGTAAVIAARRTVELVPL
jgi:membrane protease YdiL (CAAX protease family)